MRLDLVWLALIVLFLIPLGACQTFSEIDIMVPAVSQDPSTGVMVGIPVRLNVKMIDPGTGEIFVNTRALTEMDMQGSARLAAIVAGDVTGEDVDRVDFMVTLYSNSTIIGGPSAGAAMTVAMAALLERLEIRSDVMMTGMITLDEAVGVVGGIPEKASAAHQSGARMFIIPEGQAVSYNSTTYEDVNVTEMARDRWNLTVIEVADIREAITIFTGREFPARKHPTTPVAAESYLELMKAQSEDGLEEANRSYGDAHDTCLALSANLTEELVSSLEDDLNLSAQRLADAYAAHGSGQYYVATSKAFQSRITSRFVVYRATYYSTDPDGREGIIGGIWDEADLRIQEAEGFVNGTEVRGVTGIECLAAAQGRIEEAKVLLDESMVWYDLGLDDEALFQAGYSIERAFTAVTWAEMAGFFPQGPEPGADDLRLIAEGLYADASILAAYADLLYEEIFGLPISWVVALIPEYAFIDPYESLDRAGYGLEEGKWPMATFEALESETRSGLAIEFINVLVLADDLEEASDMLGSMANKSRMKCRLSIEDSRQLGIEPVISVSRYEFSEDLARSGEILDLGESVFGYRYGTSVARLSPTLLALYQPVLVVETINASFLSGDWSLRGTAHDPNGDRMGIAADLGDLRIESSTSSGPFLLVLPTNELPDGGYRLKVNLSDGSLFDVYWLNVTVDNSPPTISVSGLANGTIYDRTVLPAISAPDAVDPEPGLEILLDGKEYVNGSIGEGRHLLEVMARDWAGWESRLLLDFAVDLTPPWIEVDRPEENGTSESPLVARWVAYDNVTGVASSYWMIDSGGWNQAEETNRTPLGPGWASWFGAEVAGSDGEHSLEIRAIDGSGRESIRVVGLTIDASPPTIEILGVADSSWYSSPVNPGYSVVDEIDDEPQASATLDGAPFSSGDPVGSGRHELHVAARDAVGNANHMVVRFTVDLLAPMILTNVTDGSVYRGPISVGYGVEDDLDPDPGSSATLDGRAYNGSVILEGRHVLEIASGDSAGNQRTLALSFVVDLVPPTVTVNLQEGGWYPESPEILASFDDDLLPDLVTRVVLDGADYVGGQVGDGRHILIAWAADPGGSNVSAAVEFYVDGEAPEIRITGVEDGGIYGQWLSPTISVTDLDDAPSLSVLVDGEIYDSKEPIRDGHHEMEVSAIDRVGNMAGAKLAFTIDTIPPEVRIDLLDGGVYTGSVSPTVEVEGGEDVEMQILLDGAPYAIGQRIGPGSHVLLIEVTDRAGNVARGKIAFTVRRRLPVALIAATIVVVLAILGVMSKRRRGADRPQMYKFRRT